MIEVNFYSSKYDKREYGINFETDNYELYEMIKDYIIEHTKRVEAEEARIKEIKINEWVDKNRK